MYYLDVGPFKCSFKCSSPMFVQRVCMQSSYFVLLLKKINFFFGVFDKESFNSRNATNGKYFNLIPSYLQLLTSHSSTSAQESPSTPSVLQTAYAMGSTVSSVISEPILPTPLTPTVFPLLHYNNKKHVNVLSSSV